MGDKLILASDGLCRFDGCNILGVIIGPHGRWCTEHADHRLQELCTQVEDLTERLESDGLSDAYATETIQELIDENTRLKTALVEQEVRHIEQREHWAELVKKASNLFKPSGAATFLRRFTYSKEAPKIDPTIGEVVDRGFLGDLTIKWSNAALATGLVMTEYHTIPRDVYLSLPARVNAQNWHHLCAIIGECEMVARAFYLHPEEGQSSAVEEVEGV